MVLQADDILDFITRKCVNGVPAPQSRLLIWLHMNIHIKHKKKKAYNQLNNGLMAIELFSPRAKLKITGSRMQI